MKNGCLVLFLVIGSIFIYHPSIHAMDRFVNGNFESAWWEGPHGWWFWNGGTGSESTGLFDVYRSPGAGTLTSTPPFGRKDGKAGFKINVGPTKGAYGFIAAIAQTVNSPDYAGKSVKFSAWCRTENGGKAGLKIDITHKSGVRDTYWTPSVTTPVECPSWKAISTDWVMIPDDAVRLDFNGMASGKDGRVWFDAFTVEVTPDLPSAPVDQRFGFGGDPKIGQDLNIPWYYNWTTNLPILGRKSFMTIGKVGNDCGKVANLATLEAQGLKDDEDKNWYQKLDGVLKKFEGKPLVNGKNTGDYGGGAVCTSLDSMRADFLHIVDGVNLKNLAGKYAGMYYQIANEPDWYPYFAPADYAQYYGIFYQRIKKYDPSARVMMGGLLSISGFLYSNGDSWADKYRNYKWIDDFRVAYKSKFSVFPPVDVWSIHPYTGANWEDAKNDIIKLRNYLNGIGETKKPIWLSEFGILSTEGGLVGYPCGQHGGHGCLSQDQQNQEWGMVTNDYLVPLITWLKSTDYVQKWFWFYAGQSVGWQLSINPNATNYVGDVYLTKNGDYNPIGMKYKQLAQEGAEKIPNCSITSGPTTIALGDIATYAISFSSLQGSLGTKMSIGQNGNFQEDITGTLSSQSSMNATGTFSWKPKTLGTFDVFCRAWNDGVAECRGNTAYVDKMPRYECTGPNAAMTVRVISTNTPTPVLLVSGDYNGDRKVDLVDFGVWKTKYLAGKMTLVDFGVWKVAYLNNGK